LSNYVPNINDDLLVKYLLNETSAEEKALVEQWMESNDGNRVYFAQFKTIWEESKKLAAVSEVDEEAAWMRFKIKLNEPKQQEPKQPAPVKQINRFAWLRIAALFIIVIGAAWIFYTINKPAPIETLVASSGNAILNDTLPDGSTVILNKNSSLTYPDRFKEATRSVALKGEAFFHVTPNKEQPFTIQVNDVMVKVVGTSFNIRSDSGSTEIIVETGIVQVTHKGQMVELRPGEKLVVEETDTTLEKQKETDQLYNYYRSREFVCDNTPLWKLVDVLNKAYNANIVIERPELKTRQLTTTFSNESLDTILDIIKETFSDYNVVIEKKEDRIILR